MRRFLAMLFGNRKAKEQAIKLWRLADLLRECEVWRNESVSHTAEELDRIAIAIAKANGFEYDDVREAVDA